jgi:hypothetical protein
MLKIVCNNCGKVIKAYTGLKGVNPVEINGVDSEDFTIDDVFCGTCYKGYEFKKVDIQTQTILPIIEKYREYSRLKDTSNVSRIHGIQKIKNRYGEIWIEKCSDSDVGKFIERLSGEEKEIDMSIQRVASERGSGSLGFLLKDITLKATKFNNWRIYLEVCKGGEILEEYLYSFNRRIDETLVEV